MGYSIHSPSQWLAAHHCPPNLGVALSEEVMNCTQLGAIETTFTDVHAKNGDIGGVIFSVV